MTWGANKTIVVPIDFSDASFAALEEALEIAGSPTHIHVVHVLQDTVVAGPEFALDATDVEAGVREMTRALEERLKDPKYQGASIHVCYGDPGIEVTNFAEISKADLIVMSSHGRRGLKRLLIGSVAERIVRLAQCPVLVIK